MFFDLARWGVVWYGLSFLKGQAGLVPGTAEVSISNWGARVAMGPSTGKGGKPEPSHLLAHVSRDMPTTTPPN